MRIQVGFTDGLPRTVYDPGGRTHVHTSPSLASQNVRQTCSRCVRRRLRDFPTECALRMIDARRCMADSPHAAPTRSFLAVWPEGCRPSPHQGPLSAAGTRRRSDGPRMLSPLLLLLFLCCSRNPIPEGRLRASFPLLPPPKCIFSGILRCLCVCVPTGGSLAPSTTVVTTDVRRAGGGRGDHRVFRLSLV